MVIPLLTNLALFVDLAAYYGFNSMRPLFGFKFAKQGKHDVYRPGPTKKAIWLINHRSWADFFIDHILTGNQGAYLSRWLVIVAVPILGITGYLGDWIWFFKRPPQRPSGVPPPTGSDVSRSYLYNSLDNKFENTPWKGLIVYPEARRNLRPESLPLKFGMIKYAYEKSIEVQIIMTKDKEKVLNEKSLTSHHGVVILVQYSEVFNPEDYDNLEAFIEAIKATWESMWKDVLGDPSAKEKEKQKDGEDDKGLSPKPYDPPFVPKPGIRTSWVQVRFLIGLAVWYSVIVWTLWYFLW